MPLPTKLSQKPTQPPVFDEGTFAKRLYERVLTATTQQPYAVFKPDFFPKWARWLSGKGEYDGVGLRDCVNSNALYLDAVKDHLDRLDDREAAHHQAQSQRLSALEEGQSNFVPFGDSG
jgi:hypothetical protein